MDLLRRIKLDISRVDRDIRDIEESVLSVPTGDLRTKSDLLTLKSKYRNDKIKLLKAYHEANQDLTLRNEEIRYRIEEIKARVSLMAAASEEVRGLDELLGLMDEAIEEVIDSDEEDE